MKKQQNKQYKTKELKIYSLDSSLEFGKFKGLTIQEVMEKNANYLKWCQAKVEHFHLDLSAIAQAKIQKQSFNLSEEGAYIWSKQCKRLRKKYNVLNANRKKAFEKEIVKEHEAEVV